MRSLEEPPLRLDAPVEVLRTRTVRQVVSEIFFGRGIEHFRPERDEARKVLRVEIWWWSWASEEARRTITRELEGVLRRWVWDGWEVSIETSQRSKPDVIWDPYREKFVPRKAGVLAFEKKRRRA